jgi:hypothetical protein
MLYHRNIPLHFWGEAIQTAAYILKYILKYLAVTPLFTFLRKIARNLTPKAI